MQHPRIAGIQRRCVTTAGNAFAGGFHTHHVHAVVVDEGKEQSHRIGAAADTGHQEVRQTIFQFLALRFGFVADDPLEIAHQHGIGMRAGDAADDVVGVVDVGYPIAHGFVHGVLEGAGTGMHRRYLGAQELHAVDVDALAFDVLGAHVDAAGQTQAGGYGGGGDAVLAGAGFRDHSGLAHALCQHRLADGVVDLVGAGMA